MANLNYSTIDEYIAQCAPEVQEILRSLRDTIRAAAPDARERISWAMPTFWQNGNLVHFAAHKSHVGFYPGAEAMVKFADALSVYKTSKGAAQFPYAQPLPLELVTDIVRFRVWENTGE